MSRGRGVTLALAVGLLGVGLPGVSPAQVAVTATVASDSLYRSYDLSYGGPTLSLSALYDAPGGFYVGGAVTGVAARHRGGRFLGHMEYAGYAFRRSAATSIDIGVSNANYVQFENPAYHVDETEVYAGYVTPRLNAYVYYTPHYLNSGLKALYAEVSGNARLAGPVRVIGHLGMVTPLTGVGDRHERWDVRFGLSVPFPHGEAQVTWSESRPDLDYATNYARGRGTVALTLSRFF